ncbi:hypothetical protein MMC31_008032 [Peltigera leucophlebia]|nr:hypothetical protein [Peltigera leucophlebia]
MSDLIDLFQLEATFNSTTRSTHEIVQTSDRAQLKKEWKREADPIGHGGSGIVWLEHDSEGKQSRVVKQIRKGAATTSLPTDYKRELLALGRLSRRQDLFVHFYGWFESDTSVSLAMEYFKLGDLEKYITPNLTEKDAKMIGRQLLEGLQLMHNYKLAHRDIKPANIFVARHAPDWWVKLGDFGISRRICTEQNGGLSRSGTIDYMAPEIWLGNEDEEQARTYTLAVDIWSLGCVLFRLLTRQLPFPPENGLRLYWWSKKKFPTNILVENNVSDDGISLVSEMMKSNPADRLNASNALLHPWTSGQESKPAPCLDSYERKTKEENDDETPVVTSAIQSHSSSADASSADDSGKSVVGNKRSFLSITNRAREHQASASLVFPGTIIPPPAKSPVLASQTILGPEPDNDSTDLQFPEVVELENPILEDQKPISDLSADDPITFQSMHDLANFYYDQGKYQEAMQLYGQSLEARKRVLGDEHPDTLDSMSDLAVSYSRLGQHQKAVQLRKQTLEARKRVFGDEHPDTLHSMNDLAVSYSRLGQLQEAMQLSKQTLEAQKRVLGDQHHDTCQSMHNLAFSYSKIGQGREAVQLYKKTVEARKRVLGDEHPDTLRSMNNLATCYSQIGQDHEAVQLYKQTLEARKRVLGDEHPDTLDSMSELAVCCSILGQDQEAVQLRKQTLEARKLVLGDDHPDTLDSMSSLARSCFRLGQHHGAVQLLKQTLEARKRVLGDEHPDTLDSMSDLAVSYSRLGQHQEGVQRSKQTLEAQKRVLRDEYPDTLLSMNNLALSYSDLGQGHKAMQLHKQALEARKRVLGDEHRDTLRSMHFLAECYSNLSQNLQAVQLYKQTVEARKRVLGDEHPSTLRSMHNLAICYSDLGQDHEAMQLHKQTLEARKRVLGDKHPDTLKSMSRLAKIHDSKKFHRDKKGQPTTPAKGFLRRFSFLKTS